MIGIFSRAGRAAFGRAIRSAGASRLPEPNRPARPLDQV
jgi:hypothetical protein